MILLWGLLRDGPLRAVYEALQRRNAPVFLLDQQHVLDTQIDLTVDTTIRGTLCVGHMVHDLAYLHSAYIRCFAAGRLPEIGEAGPDNANWRHAVGLDEAISAWLEVTPARVLNRLSAMASNGSKPYQLSVIRSVGFETPDTLVTTDPAAARAFWEQHADVIYKSVSGIRSIVSRLKAEHVGRLEDIRWCPTQFQAFVPGEDYRVHIVGDDAFACRIVSDAEDYRYGGGVELKACKLPPDCIDRCFSLAKLLNLPLAGIDLRRTPTGLWHCFEVNPSPGFTFFEAATEQPIAEAVASLLAA